mgnify:CR=1 FL=1|jgi:MFS family permease
MNESMMRRSILLGASIGAIFGGLIGAGAGAVTLTINGILVGLLIGFLLGGVTGVLTAALTVKTAGTTGGIGVGYFTGIVFGAVFGMILGALVPMSLWIGVLANGLPMLDGLALSRLETVFHISFLLSVLAAIVGVWVSGKNLVPINLSVAREDRIDQYDLVEIVVVPEQYRGIIEVGDIGVAVEIYNHEDFEIECVNPDGSYKWLATLNGRYIRLKSKIPDNMYM